MTTNEAINWMKTVFGEDLPDDYVEFFKNGDFQSTLRKYYIVDQEAGNAVEISDWFTADTIASVYQNCVAERLLDPWFIPIFDSCACTVAIDCRADSETYHQLMMRVPTGYYDENFGVNVYDDMEFVAKNFSEFMNNLKTDEELEAMGL